jgi:branched-chain amino acid transport system ATP-binding protein
MTLGARLEVQEILRTFGGIRAVDGLTFAADHGETVGVVGPNGAGKTSLLNIISGVYPAESGRITLDGDRIDTLRPDRIARLGVARTFQLTGQFHEFKVIDYLTLARPQPIRWSVISSALTLPHIRRFERVERRRSYELLERLGLETFANQRLRELPYGVQKLVDIARVVSADPRLILLDEPTSGTTSTERDAIAEILREVAASGVTMLIVDHDVAFVSGLSRSLVAMNYGRLLAHGTPDDVLRHEEVVSSFIGTPKETNGTRPDPTTRPPTEDAL